MRLGPRQNVERQGQQPVARQDRGRLVERLVRGRPSAPKIVIVHRRQVVMRERVAMHAFERRAGHQGVPARRLEQRGGLDHEKRPQPFAAAERHMAHRIHQPLRACALLGEHGVVEQQAEQRFGVGRNAVEALPERRSGVDHVVHVRRLWVGIQSGNQQVGGDPASRNGPNWLTWAAPYGIRNPGPQPTAGGCWT
jgi:hypothetical protein